MNVSLYQAAAALNANARWQETIAENLASSSIPGFKRQDMSFKAIESGLIPTQGNGATGTPAHFGLPQIQPATNFGPGQLRPTGVDTDVALEGPGFFEVQLANGASAYTRDGEFHINAQGQLVTKQGYAVLGDTGTIQLNPNNHRALTISSSGQISQGTELRGKLKAVDFNDRQLLTHLGGGYFQAMDPKLQALEAPDAAFKQRCLEGANTTPVAEMVNLLSAMRSYEANQRLIQVNDERMGTAIRDLAGAP